MTRSCLGDVNYLLMNERVQWVCEKTGLSEPIAKVAVELVVNFVKEKLPTPLANPVDMALGGASMGDDLKKGWVGSSVSSVPGWVPG